MPGPQNLFHYYTCTPIYSKVIVPGYTYKLYLALRILMTYGYKSCSYDSNYEIKAPKK